MFGFAFLGYIVLLAQTADAIVTSWSSESFLESAASSCRMVTSSQSFRKENIIFVSPSSIVLQDKPFGTEGIVKRFIALRTESGYCREESSMNLNCTNAGAPAQGTCDEFMGSENRDSCFVAPTQRCESVGLVNFLRPQVVAGLQPLEDQAEQLLQVPRVGLRALVLGASCGSIPSYISRNFPQSHVTAVDIDPAAIYSARRFFDNTAQNINYVVGDALAELRRQPDVSRDVIFIDAYDKSDNAPAALYDRSTMELAKAKLRPGGRIVLVIIDRRVADVQADMTSLGLSAAKLNWGGAYPTIVGTLQGSTPILGSSKAFEDMRQWRQH